MERIVRHLLVLGVIVAMLTTNLPRFVARFFNNDFHIADMYYQIRDEENVPIDNDIVLVNIGNSSRKDVAKQIFKLAQFNPKVIGLDVFFETARDSADDALMEYVLANTPNVVLVSLSEQDSLGEHLKTAYAPFAQQTRHGIAENLIDGGVGRRFNKFYTFGPDTVLHFGAQIVQLFDSAKVQKLMARPGLREEIYFRGNITSFDSPEPSKFTVLDVQDVVDENFTPDLIEGKIVMMGYLGSYAGDPYTVEDKFFSPLNKEISARSVPDMFGVVFHANIVSMIMNEAYIDTITEREEYGLAALIGLFNILIFWAILSSSRLNHWYNVMAGLIIGAEMIIYPYLSVYLLIEYSFLLELSTTLIVILLSAYVTKVFLYRPLQWLLKPSVDLAPSSSNKEIALSEEISASEKTSASEEGLLPKEIGTSNSSPDKKANAD